MLISLNDQQHVHKHPAVTNGSKTKTIKNIFVNRNKVK